MKRLAVAFVPLVLAACTEAPPTELPAEGSTYVRTAEGILQVDYVVAGDRVAVDDMTFPIDDFTAAMIDEADLADAVDALGEDHDRAAVRSIGRARWPGGRIPWRFGAGMTAAQQANVNTAIAHWQANTPIRFVARTTEADYITFVPGDSDNSCHSDVGRSGGEQQVEVDTCASGNIIHELGHAVGFFHEHQRADRDSFVTINWNNIQTTPKDRRGNFYKYVDDGRGGTDVGTYDYGSIMHYAPTSFSANGLNTITPTTAGVTIGQRIALSQGDIDAAYRLVTPGGVYSGGPVVTLFRDPGLQGISQSFGLGQYTAARGDFGTIGDNTTSSIAIPAGVWVSVWTGGLFDPFTGYGGTQNALSPSFDNAISTIIISRAVTAFRDANQAGISQTFQIGEYKASSGQMSIVGDNQITSLVVPPGLVVEVCQSNSGGACQTFESNVNAFPIVLDNQASLLRVKAAVTVYESAVFLGRRKSLTVGTYTAAGFAPVPDQQIESLVVGDGLKATVCTFPDGTGSCEVFRGDVTWVGETIDDFGGSWIKIEPNTAP